MSITRFAERASGPTAFVLYVHIGGLGVIRSLGRAGVPVVGLGDDPRQAGFASRYCVARQSPDHARHPDEMVRFLLREAEQLTEPGILFPTSDASMAFLSRHRNELKDHFRFILPPPEVAEAGIDKRKQYQYAEQLGVPYATTHYPETMDDVRALQHSLDYPVYVKPYSSHVWLERFRTLGKGVKVHTPQELVSTFETIFPSGLRAMVQSIVLGPITNLVGATVYLDAAGEPLAIFGTRKLRQDPPELGRGTMMESWFDPEVIELALRYLRGIGYRGVGYLEFKRDERDGLLKLIELNARYPWHIGHATDCGINIPLIQYDDLRGREPAPQLAFKEGVRWVHGARDLRSYVSSLRADRRLPEAGIRTWLGARSFALLAADDPGPFVASWKHRVRSLARRRAPNARPAAP